MIHELLKEGSHKFKRPVFLGPKWSSSGCEEDQTCIIWVHSRVTALQIYELRKDLEETNSGNKQQQQKQSDAVASWESRYTCCRCRSDRYKDLAKRMWRASCFIRCDCMEELSRPFGYVYSPILDLGNQLCSCPAWQPELNCVMYTSTIKLHLHMSVAFWRIFLVSALPYIDFSLQCSSAIPISVLHLVCMHNTCATVCASIHVVT